MLLASGHTVRVALRDNDQAPTSNGSTESFLEDLPAVTSYLENGIVFAYVEDRTFPAMKPNGVEFEEPNDFQRIDVLSPGDAGGTA
jgi:hypothetical protein